jgi:hypothetical protein
MKITVFLNRAKASYGHFGLAITLSILLVSNSGFAVTGEKKTNIRIPPMIYRDGKLTVNMPSIRLNEAMKEFSRVTGIEVIWHRGEICKPVELGFSAYSVQEAIERLLYGESYMLFFSSADRGQGITRITILGHKKADETAISVAQPSAMTNVFTMNRLDEEIGQNIGSLEQAEMDRTVSTVWSGDPRSNEEGR